MHAHVASTHLVRAAEVIEGGGTDEYRHFLLDAVLASGKAGEGLSTISYLSTAFEGATSERHLSPQEVARALQIDGRVGAQHRFVNHGIKEVIAKTRPLCMDLPSSLSGRTSMLTQYVMTMSCIVKIHNSSGL